jgi:osmoprotectant transport system ATP-binding protein
MPAAAPMIELQSVTKRYDATAVVTDLSLSIAEGELLVLLGGSGSGKTTTLKMINRLIEPSGGTIRVDGEDIARIDPPLLRRRIGYVFQKVGLFPHLTIAENIAVTPALLGWDMARIRRRVEELLDLVELDAATGARFPGQLSGGQEQRVGVARALAAEPKVMLLDEPFGALDPLTRDRLQRSFLAIRKRLGLTAIFVTHDMAEALLLGDRIGVMHRGRLAQIGSPQDLLQRPADDYVRQLSETASRHADLVERLKHMGST